MVEVYVSKLRKLIEPAWAGRRQELLLTRAPGYVLRVGPERLDVLRFEALLAEGRDALAAGARAHAAAVLRSALSLWRGPALADFAFEPFAQAEIARLEELRLACLEERIEADLALGGRDPELVGELEALTTEHPLRERLRGQRMLALYRTGRQVEALEAYRSARETLVTELGVEPGTELRRLEQAILRQDPALTAPSGVERLRKAAAPPARRRKTVTVLVVELTAATTAGEPPDPEALHDVLEPDIARVSDILSRHGGTVETVGGGAVLAVFGSPLAREDDAFRAVRAAVETAEVLASDSEERTRVSGIEVGVHIGIDTAEAVVLLQRPGEAAVTTDAGKFAARLAQVAGRGETALGEATRRLVADAVVVERLPGLAAAGRRARPA